MNVRWLFTLLITFPAMAIAQGFAGLGSEVTGFAQPERGRDLRFPQDHGAHPDYRVEWWYLTANLKDTEGTDYGLQWTLFRSALRAESGGAGEGWQNPQLWMGHAAITTPDRHFVAERLGRGGIGQAGVKSEPFEAWIDEWQLKGAADLSKLALRARGTDFGYDMSLAAMGPLVLHGDNGYSVKSIDGQASHYYSQPFFQIDGTLLLPLGEIEVSGTAWFDREWSSQPLADTQDSWDWFSLSFDNGARMMGFQVRETDGSVFTSGTWIEPDGRATPVPAGAFTAEPVLFAAVAGRDLPTTWHLRLPLRDVDVTIKALNDNAWMDTTIPYWEGPVRISGSHGGQGYLEMTGY